MPELNCENCSLSFGNLAVLNLHLKLVHPDIVPKEETKNHHEGEKCENEFREETISTDSNSQEVAQKSQNSFQCQFCEKKFAKNSNKIRHERTHTGERNISVSIL